MKGVAPIITVGVLIGAIIIGFILIFLHNFYSSTEMKLSDRIAGGLSTINYYYLSEKNMNEFLKIVTEITAKELGEKCGGFECNWHANLPSIEEIKNKFKETLKGKITSYPEFIGNGGRIKVTPPSNINTIVSDYIITTTMKPQSFSFERKKSIIKSYLKGTVEIKKPIRYLKIAKLSRRFYANGTYVRDSNKIYVNSGDFDCDNDGNAEKHISNSLLSSSGVDGCKIKNINFNVNEVNSLKTECEGITNSKNPGKYAGFVSGGRIHVRIDNMFRYSLLCGIGSSEGLAGINDFQGTYTETQSYSGSSDCSEGRKTVSCTAQKAVKDTDWIRLDSKINNIISSLKSVFTNEYLNGIDISIEINPSFSKTWQLYDYKTPKNFYNGCAGSHYLRTGNKISGTCAYNYEDLSYSGSCGCGISGYSYSHKKYHNTYNWGKKNYYEYKYSCSRSGSCRTGSCCSWELVCTLFKCYRDCDAYSHSKRYSTSESWSCSYTGNYKFTISDFEAVIKLTDNTIKIVKKGTTDFENLYFKTNFTAGENYVLKQI